MESKSSVSRLLKIVCLIGGFLLINTAMTAKPVIVNYNLRYRIDFAGEKLYCETEQSQNQNTGERLDTDQQVIGSYFVG